MRLISTNFTTLELTLCSCLVPVHLRTATARPTVCLSCSGCCCCHSVSMHDASLQELKRGGGDLAEAHAPAQLSGYQLDT
ncbi:hypothetical protein PR003_g18457 [Phytophthora rubi]|uniref:Secreted protein n=1 Tax=Phytophthora rubi TaxID=129364 RepID=A0A6A3KG09_9STRA|nr:hypothetical protein PR001_g17232 [Phytophthora rubi]KAE9317509.1 hypothetical protein PR003_g18457 [Phytophthora rubi]